MADKKQDVDSVAADELGHFRHHFSITMEIDKHPLLMAMAAIAAFLVIVYVYKHGLANQGTASTDTTGTIPTTGTVPVDITNPSLPITITNPPTPPPVTLPPPVTSPSPKGPVPPFAVVKAGGAKLFDSPGGKLSPSIPTLPSGGWVHITGNRISVKSGYYYPVSYTDSTGHNHGGYVLTGEVGPVHSS